MFPWLPPGLVSAPGCRPQAGPVPGGRQEVTALLSPDLFLAPYVSEVLCCFYEILFKKNKTKAMQSKVLRVNLVENGFLLLSIVKEWGVLGSGEKGLRFFSLSFGFPATSRLHVGRGQG